MLGPQSGTAGTLWLLRQGSILGAGGASSGSTEPFEFGVGDMFPVGAVLAGRAVTSTYTEHGDSFSLALPADEVRRLASAKQISTQLSAAPTRPRCAIWPGRSASSRVTCSARACMRASSPS